MANDHSDVLLIFALVGLAMWYPHGYKLTYTKAGNVNTEADAKSEDANVAESEPAAESEHADQNPNLRYGVNQREYDAYITSFGKCYPIKPVTVNATDIDNSMDSNMAMIGQKRARDKHAIDGAVIKDANFYRHHFADELDQAEKKVWWGESEF